MIDRNTKVVGVAADLNLTQFMAILDSNKSPVMIYGPAIYNLIIQAKISPAFALAQFREEDSMGTTGISVKSFNPGNVRTSLTGLGTALPTAKGQFIYFRNWLDGWKEYVTHLTASNSVYAQEGRTTIEQIITRWAPPSENNTEQYISNVISFMSEWEAGKSMADLFPTAADLGLPANLVRIHKAADIGPWRPVSQIKWNIGHDTQGGAAGSEQVLTADDGNIASCHAQINVDGLIILMVPLDFTAWTPGNDYYAERSINIELVGFQTGPYTEAQYRSYAAYYRWAVGQGCPIANAYIGRKGLASGHLGHEDVPNPFGPGYGGRSGHTDPGAYFLWDKFVQYCGGTIVDFEPNPKKLNVGAGMLDFAKLHQLKFIVAEQFFSPNSNQPGLGQMSRAWVQDGSGVTYILMASELIELARPGEATPWKIEKLELV
jgi:hypothetical protein